MDAAADVERILRARTPYDVLDVQIGADPSVVRRAYLTMSRRVHPDRCAHAGAKRAFQRLSNAYNHLCDPRHTPFSGDAGGPPSSTGDDGDETMRGAYDDILRDFMDNKLGTLFWVLAQIKRAHPEQMGALDPAELEALLRRSQQHLRTAATVSGPLHATLLELNAHHLELRALPFLALRSRTLVLAKALVTLVSVPQRVNDALPESAKWLSPGSVAVLETLKSLLGAFDSWVTWSRKLF